MYCQSWQKNEIFFVKEFYGRSYFFKSFIQVARLQQINVNLTVICVYSSILHRIMFCLYCLVFATSCWKSGFQRSWVRSWSGRNGVEICKKDTTKCLNLNYSSLFHNFWNSQSVIINRMGVFFNWKKTIKLTLGFS